MEERVKKCGDCIHECDDYCLTHTYCDGKCFESVHNFIVNAWKNNGKNESEVDE